MDALLLWLFGTTRPDMALLLLVFAGCLLIVLREGWTWFGKQSRRTEALEDAARTLQLLEEQGRPLPPGAPRAPDAPRRPPLAPRG